MMRFYDRNTSTQKQGRVVSCRMLLVPGKNVNIVRTTPTRHKVEVLTRQSQTCYSWSYVARPRIPTDSVEVLL